MLAGPWTAPTVKLVRAPFEHVMETSRENTETAGLMEAASKDDYGRKQQKLPDCHSEVIVFDGVGRTAVSPTS